MVVVEGRGIIDVSIKSAFMEEKTKIIKFEVPESLHTEFKILCARLQENMKDRAKGLIEVDIANSKNGIDTPINPSSVEENHALSFLKRLEQKDLPKNGELVVFAHELGVSVEFLKMLCDCVRNHDGVKVGK